MQRGPTTRYARRTLTPQPTDRIPNALLFFVQDRSVERATLNRLVERWISVVTNYQAQDVRLVCNLSAEFLTGPHLANNLVNLGIYDEASWNI